MQRRNILSLATLLALAGNVSINENYRAREPEPEPEPRRRLPTSARLWSEEIGYNDRPRIQRQPTTAELSKARSMDRKWRKAAAQYPYSRAAMALSDMEPW